MLRGRSSSGRRSVEKPGEIAQEFADTDANDLRRPLLLTGNQTVPFILACAEPRNALHRSTVGFRRTKREVVLDLASIATKVDIRFQDPTVPQLAPEHWSVPTAAGKIGLAELRSQLRQHRGPQLAAVWA